MKYKTNCQFGGRGDPYLKYGTLGDPPVQIEARGDPPWIFDSKGDPPENTSLHGCDIANSQNIKLNDS